MRFVCIFLLFVFVDISKGFWSKKKPAAKEGDVRLVGGPDKVSGRIEVYHGGKWGSVCDNHFNINAATVVCKQLGLAGGTPKWHAFYGQGSGPVYLGSMSCSSTEASISQCSGLAWDAKGCPHKEDAGVICQGDKTNEGDVRLVRGGRDGLSGRVEVYHLGKWGTVCSNFFGSVEAKVVCRQLGFSGLRAEAKSFGAGSGSTFLSDLQCTGNEGRLESCSHRGWTGASCSHSRDAGVVCQRVSQQDLKTEGQVRLSGGRGRSSGRVEIFHNGEWGTVCKEQFDSRAAYIVCKKLGFAQGGKIVSSRGFGSGTGPIWLHDVVCTGNEADLIYCSHGDWGKGQCIHDEDVSVECQSTTGGNRPAPGPARPAPAPARPAPSTNGNSRPSNGNLGALAKEHQIRLVGGRREGEGRVEIFHAGEWGTICDDGWDGRAADVVCKQLGFTNGIHRVRGFHGYGTGPIWLDDMSCDGNERSIINCRHSDWGVTDCSHGEDVGVDCF